MADFKIVVSDPKSQKTYQSVVEQKQSQLIGKKIGEKFKGDVVGLTGYELQITGGSDRDGFPMRKDVEGIARKKLLITAGVGFHSSRKGARKRKSVRGNTISVTVSQINTKVVTYGSKPIEKLMSKAEKGGEGEAKAEPPKEAPKAEEKPKEGAKSAEAPKKTEATKEEPKQEESAEAKAEKPKEEAKPEK